MTTSADEKYLAALLSEREKLFNLKVTTPISCKLVDDEIQRIQTKLGITNSALYNLTPTTGVVTKLTEKIYVPVESNPNYNFVGRILGPRGLTLKRMETESGCKLMIRGRGSTRDKEKEETLKGQSGWEHLNEPLHVVIEVEMEEDEAIKAVSIAKDLLTKLMSPDSGQDQEKAKQLRQLALIKFSEQIEKANKVTQKFISPEEPDHRRHRSQPYSRNHHSHNYPQGYYPRRDENYDRGLQPYYQEGYPSYNPPRYY